MTFGNNAALCIATGATLNFGANNYSVVTTNDKFTIDVYGTLNVNQNPTWRGKMDIVVHSGGKLNIPNTITLNGVVMNIVNNGTLSAGTFQFQQSGAVITIENNNSMAVSGTLNISQGTAQFWNKGTLSVDQNYNSSSTSVYVNCGTFNGRFNLNYGGKLINTGTFTSGQIDFGNSSSRVENYGQFTATNSINLSGATFYNQGIMKFTSGYFQGNGTLQGPSDNNYKGYFGWTGTCSLNSPVVGPNLYFGGPSTMFNGSQQIQGTVLFNKSESDVTIPPNIACPNADGKPAVPVPASTTSCIGVNLTSLQPSLVGITYEWWTGSATTRTTQITSSTTPLVTNYTTSGTVYLWAKNVSSGVYSNQGAAVVISLKPIISVHPSTIPQTVCQGDIASTLSVTATAGSGTISSYQWYSNSANSNTGGTIIIGATSSSYTPPTTTVGTLYYYCTVTNSIGCTTTSNVSGAINVITPIALTLANNTSSPACPDLVYDFNPDNSNYYAGNSQVIFKITRTNSTSAWTFNYEITEVSGLLSGLFNVASISVIGEGGSTANITNTPGGVNGTGTISVGAVYNYIELIVRVKNLPGETQQVQLNVANATDGSCTNNSNTTILHTINPMPIVGNFN